ncbi:MAG: hypothetical protein AMXMBFR59_07410 [Rhodanobacteraceae bacterium]
MSVPSRRWGIVALAAIVVPVTFPAIAQEIAMREHISGRFDVRLIPQDDADDPSGIARLLLDKTFHGALEAGSRGQMLGVRTAGGTSGGYVALEKVSGTLNGRRGAFHLQHYGLATRGVNTLTLQVVPDSGTDELEGLAGTMKIIIDEKGEHFYEFDFGFDARQ